MTLTPCKPCNGLGYRKTQETPRWRECADCEGTGLTGWPHHADETTTTQKETT